MHYRCSIKNKTNSNHFTTFISRAVVFVVFINFNVVAWIIAALMSSRCCVLCLLRNKVRETHKLLAFLLGTYWSVMTLVGSYRDGSLMRNLLSIYLSNKSIGVDASLRADFLDVNAHRWKAEKSDWARPMAKAIPSNYCPKSFQQFLIGNYSWFRDLINCF